MTDEEIYVDWGALRLVVPMAIGLVVSVLLGLLALRFVAGWGDGDSPASQEEPSSADSVEAVPLTPEGQAGQALDGFLAGLGQGRLTGRSYAFDEGAEVQADYESIVAELGPITLSSRPEPVRLVDDANATATVAHDWVLDDGRAFTSEGKVDLVLIGTQWQVDWQPSVLIENLVPGDLLVKERVVAPRAPILGRDGAPLVENRQVIEIGVVPRLADDVAGLTDRLAQLLGEDADEMRARISPSPSDSLVPITVRRPDAIASFRNQLQTLPGVVLTESTFPLTPYDGFGRALLGRAAEVTAEIIDESPEYFVAGDVAGRSGLQREYNQQLSGRPGFQVAIRRKFPGAGTGSRTSPAQTATTTTNPTEDGNGGAGDEQGETPVPEGGVGADDEVAPETAPGGGTLSPDVVYLEPPEQPTALQLTIDPDVQSAAENALGRTGNNSALVAIEISTGNLLAVANGPVGATGNVALTGQYPPGSIFKTVTAYGALRRGIGPETPIDCPETLNVNGRDFRNAEGEALGTVPFWLNYAQSCNTAFINLASSLDASDFSSNALAMGVGDQYQLGTASFGGSVPNPSGPVERAATSFGQSQILMSPLSAAVMAATAAGGSYRPPVLVVDPELPPRAEQPLDPAAADPLRQMMRAVVTQGTGSAVGNVAGGPVSGKTGTAEYGSENPPRTHAWFVGFQDDIAFAVFVEDGQFGGTTAAPLASAFLNDLRNR